ncbi:hypothetical protein SUGI_0018580 [Cryptomeria japonica]|nr:hypothetical protein SUGI_0018580 [Cryptomeria japonica]
MCMQIVASVSSNFAWEYGVNGPFWYASGATIQVLLFGIMAIEIKRKAPYVHTICEIVHARAVVESHHTLFQTLVILVITSAITFPLVKSSTQKSSMALPPRPQPWPLLGNLPELLYNGTLQPSSHVHGGEHSGWVPHSQGKAGMHGSWSGHFNNSHALDLPASLLQLISYSRI